VVQVGIRKWDLALEKNDGILKLMQFKKDGETISPFGSLPTKKLYVHFNPSVS